MQNAEKTVSREILLTWQRPPTTVSICFLCREKLPPQDFGLGEVCDSAPYECWTLLTLQDDVVEADDKYYDASETAIADKALLAAHGQKLCHNVDVYWMTETCHADTKERKCYYCNQSERNFYFIYPYDE